MYIMTFCAIFSNYEKDPTVYLIRRRPLQINIKNRMIGLWISIINGKNSKLTNLLYNTLYNENELGIYNFKWIKCIKDALISVGKIG